MKQIAFILMLKLGLIAQVFADVETINIAGIVTDVQGNPIAGAEVSAVATLPDPGRPVVSKVLASATSDAQGRFELKSVKIEGYPAQTSVRATANRFAWGMVSCRDSVFFDFVRQRGSAEAWIILFPAEVLEGTIVDEEDKPVKGAILMGDLSRDSFTTAEDGKFRFEKATVSRAGALSGERRLSVSHPDFCSLSIRDWSVSGEGKIGTGPQTIKLERGIKITGRITERDSGKGLAKMGIWGRASWIFDGSFSTKTDDDGRYTLRMPAPPQVSAGRPGRRETQATLQISNPNWFEPGIGDTRPTETERKIDLADAPDNTIDNIDFVFEKSITLRGTIHAAEGAMPPDRFALRAIPIPQGDSREPRDGSILRGKFAVPMLDAGKYELSVIRATGSGEIATLWKQEIEIKDPPETLDITLPKVIDDAQPAPPQLHGTVRDSAGNISRLAKVNSYSEDFRSSGYGYTDLAGEYTIPRFGPDTRMLFAWDSTGALVGTTEIPDGFDIAQPMDIKLHPGAEISGLIHDPAGNPVAGMQVVLGLEKGRSTAHMITSETDEQGRYTLKGVWHPGGGQKITVTPRPHIDRVEHYNYTIATRDVPSELTESQKLDGYDFEVDLSQPMIKVKADPVKAD